MCEFNCEAIENQIGYTFTNKKLLKQAFTRRSYSQEHGGENNEVLEFYGDKVLEFIVGKILAEQFGRFKEYEKAIQQIPLNIDLLNSNKTIGEYSSDYDEGQLTEFRKMLVSRQTLAQRIYDLDLEKYLFLGRSDEENNVRDNDAVREDLFEAILGAIALDSFWNIEKMQNAVEVMLCPGAFLSNENYVRDVTQWTINEYGCVPEFYYGGLSYMYSRMENTICDRDSTHYPPSRNHCYMKLGAYQYYFYAEGKTLGEARDNACRCAYRHLKEKDLLNPIQDEIEEPSEAMAINDLEILSRRGYFDLPKYKYTETHDKDGNPKWQVTCMINGFDKVFNATSTSKKAAKKKAAFRMLNYVLENYDKED